MTSLNHIVFYQVNKKIAAQLEIVAERDLAWMLSNKSKIESLISSRDS